MSFSSDSRSSGRMLSLCHPLLYHPYSGPAIPVSAFHEVLGVLLLSEGNIISSTTQDAIVQLLLRLDEQTPSSSASGGEENEPERQQRSEEPTQEPSRPASESGSRRHEHPAYKLPQEAKDLIASDLVRNVVVALARLDSEVQPDLVHEIRHAHEEHSNGHTESCPSAETAHEVSDQPAPPISWCYRSRIYSLAH